MLAANNQRIAEELEDNQNITNISLWPQPFQAVQDELGMTEQQRIEAARQFRLFAQRPRLWKARVLHFQGTKDIPADQQSDPLAQPDLGHEQATALYVNPRIRPPKAILDRIEPSKRILYNQVKSSASYWQGLLRYDLGDYQVARNWLDELTLKADPGGPWTAGASYNLARVYEALGQPEKAVELLSSNDSPQSHGNRLRRQEHPCELREPRDHDDPITARSNQRL